MKRDVEREWINLLISDKTRDNPKMQRIKRNDYHNYDGKKVSHTVQ